MSKKNNKKNDAKSNIEFDIIFLLYQINHIPAACASQS